MKTHMEGATPAAAAESGRDHDIFQSIKGRSDVNDVGRSRKCRRWAGVATGTLFVVIIAMLLVLVFAIFKAKDPRIVVNSVDLKGFNGSFTLPALQPSLNVLLRLNITLHNPNRAGFRYGNGTSFLFYHGEEVGEALIPAGEISAGGEETMVTMVDIEAGRFLANSNLFSDMSLGILPISSQTRLSGRIRLLGIIKRHAIAKSFCNIVVSISSRNIQEVHCSYKVKV